MLRTAGLLRTLRTFDTGYIKFFFFAQPRFVMYCEHRARLGTEDVIILYSITRAILPNAHVSDLARMCRGVLLL